MKKWFVLFYAVFFALITITTICIVIKLDKVKKEEQKEENITERISQITKYITDNKVKEKIKLKLAVTGEVVEIDVQDYLKGVLPSEMPPEYDMEALKAQAIIARTYLYYKMGTSSHADADICDSPSHCQAYYNTEKICEIWKNTKHIDDATRDVYLTKINEAVDSTKNVVATYNGEYIKAYFHACSGGTTENVANIWGKQDIPYLHSVESLGEEDYRNYTSSASFTLSELQEKLNESSSIPCSISKEEGDIVEILSYTDTNRVDKVKIGGTVYTAERLRTALGLKSTNFSVEYKENMVVFNVKGYGHGVGMSQVGANYYAQNGYTYDKIISHYYTGVEVTFVNKEEEVTNEDTF